MDKAQILRALIAGLCFGIWPLMMNKGGLNGNLASFVFATIAMLCIAPFAYSSLGELGNARWVVVISAGILGAIGLLFFTSMLTKSSPTNVSSLFVTMVVIQTAIPIIYQLVVTGGMTVTKGVGFGFAVLAAILLSL